MATFSERYGISGPAVVQHRAMDMRLRNAIWSVLHEHMEAMKEAYDGRDIDQYVAALRLVWVEFFGGAGDRVNLSNARLTLRTHFYKLDWNKVYELVEFVTKHKAWTDRDLIANMNKALIREHAGYRVSDGGSVMEVTDEHQLGAINQAMQATSKVDEVHKHLAEAQKCYAQRDDGGYRNCMKESICAVETLAKLIVKQPHATLGQVLPTLSNFIKIHPRQVDSWRDVWGYTSDRPGVRHGAPEADIGPVTAPEALHMLVMCSSFVTYLLERVAQAKIVLA